MSDDPGITRISTFACSRCGHVMDAVGTSDGSVAAPQVGDICGCIACGLPTIFIEGFDKQLRLRAMTDAEIAACSDDQRRELARLESFAQRVYQPLWGRERN